MYVQYILSTSCRCKAVKYLLLKLCALERLTVLRASMSNQSRMRVSLRGVKVPACCYLCWGSALVTELLRLQAVTLRSPGELFIFAARSSPTAVGSKGSSVRQPGRRDGSHRRKRRERQWKGGFSHCPLMVVTSHCLPKLRFIPYHSLLCRWSLTELKALYFTS